MNKPCAIAARRGAGLVSNSFGPLTEGRRHITRLYTSYYRGQLFPNQLVTVRERLPKGAKFTGAGRKASAATSQAAPAATEGVSWTPEESNALTSQHNGADERRIEAAGDGRPARPYVPLGEVAKLELQGDYLSEGGLFQDALEFYGVVAKAYQLAYPEHHSQRIGILIKLGGALRRTERVKSSSAVLEKALASLDESPNPSVELIVEALLELGLTKEAAGAEDAALPYEEATAVVNEFHNFGESHRMLRLLPRLGRRFNLNHEEKFLYYSPFDYDRTFALIDQCLRRAEAYYRARDDSEAIIRVLEQRRHMIDKKFFNMRDFAGRIHTMRGHWMRRAGVLTNAPTPDELLRFSPTVHQVHRDFKYELNAPIGREKEVQQGVNRVALDMGNPYRRRGNQARKMMRDADYNFAKYVRSTEYNE